MIGKLSGKIDAISGSHVILDVGGVGYVVMCSVRTLREMGAIGEAVSLRIETHVREDAINLYGFIDTTEQEWFRLLTTVQGVGAKVALSVLGVVSPEQLAQAIAAQDKTVLTQADGVGPKLALRIVTELKDKVPALLALAGSRAEGGGALSPVLSPSLVGDAVSALLNLGYRRAEAFAAVSLANKRSPDAALDALIRASLSELSRKDTAA